MTLAYIILGSIIVMVLIFIYPRNKERKSPYFKIKSKLEDDLLQANFISDWKKKQELNLQLLWLKVISDVEKMKLKGIEKEGSEIVNRFVKFKKKV